MPHQLIYVQGDLQTTMQHTAHEPQCNNNGYREAVQLAILDTRQNCSNVFKAILSSLSRLLD